MTVRARTHRVIQIGWPEFGQAVYPPPTSSSELQQRVDKLRARMDERKLTHLVVYGDREHFANLAYLTGFDPRFEEALLILSSHGTPLLVVGNECEAYVGVSQLFNEGKLRRERFQPFSLLNQPRDQSRTIREIFAAEGLNAASRVGCVGWKYFSDHEHPNAQYAIELPSYLVDTLREIAGHDRVVNSTDLLMHPGYGLRTVCTPAEIAYFEYTSVQASESVKRMIFGMREGMTDHEVVALGGTCGEPLGCHVTFTTGRTSALGLSGPKDERIVRGQPLSMNLCYWGSNSCRSGWVASSFHDLPAPAADYVAGFAGAYYEVMSEWFALLKPGTPGGQLWRLIRERLPFERFGIFLNPGHLIHLDEWLSSPIYANSDVPLHSGMAIQVDVIPSSPVYASTRMEDGLILADKELRKQLSDAFPDCYARCQKRRKFMTDVLGIELPEEVLPLSNIPAIVPPFFLAPNEVFALEP
jgi:Creatinase/Prolidase N-terminal domain